MQKTSSYYELIGALGNTVWQCTIVVWDVYQLITGKVVMQRSLYDG